MAASSLLPTAVHANVMQVIGGGSPPGAEGICWRRRRVQSLATAPPSEWPVFFGGKLTAGESPRHQAVGRQQWAGAECWRGLMEGQGREDVRRCVSEHEDRKGAEEGGARWREQRGGARAAQEPGGAAH